MKLWSCVWLLCFDRQQMNARYLAITPYRTNNNNDILFYIYISIYVVCSQVEVCALGWSLVQRSPTEGGVSECDREATQNRVEAPQKGWSGWIKQQEHVRHTCTTHNAKLFVHFLAFFPRTKQNVLWASEQGWTGDSGWAFVQLVMNFHTLYS